MLDVAYRGTVRRICPEGPIPILDVERTDYYAGGAANVALNLRSLGVPTQLVSALEDQSQAGEKLQFLLGDLGTFAMYTERTTTKRRLFSGNHLLYRFDDNVTCAGGMIEFLGALNEWNPEIVVLSDYARGVLYNSQGMIAECRRRGILSVVDAKGALWHKYTSADIVKCNTPEAQGLKSGLFATKSYYNIKNVIVTGPHQVEHFPEAPLTINKYKVPIRSVVDVTGAGDSFLAGMVWGLAEGQPLIEAIYGGVAAGSAVVCYPGTHIVTPDEVKYGIDELKLHH